MNSVRTIKPNAIPPEQTILTIEERPKGKDGGRGEGSSFRFSKEEGERREPPLEIVKTRWHRSPRKSTDS